MSVFSQYVRKLTGPGLLFYLGLGTSWELVRGLIGPIFPLLRKIRRGKGSVESGKKEYLNIEVNGREVWKKKRINPSNCDGWKEAPSAGWMDSYTCFAEETWADGFKYIFSFLTPFHIFF